MWKFLTVFCIVLITVFGKTVFYDSFYGTVLTDEQVKKHVNDNTTFWCINEIEPCDPEEGRRLDGSCNNLQHPTRGATHTPFHRVLSPVYDDGKINLHLQIVNFEATGHLEQQTSSEKKPKKLKDFEPRRSKSGEKLPLSRHLRTSLLSEGHVPSQTFTQLVTHYLIFMASDVTGPHDTVNYVFWKPYCCLPKGKSDYMCAPNEIPDDDPVHRFSDIRCLNMTRPISFQSSRCLPNNTTPERLDTATPLLDLSTVYGRDLNASRAKARQFKGGLLKYEVENGRVWPPSQKPSMNLCYGNEKPFETRCHATPDDTTNSVLGINLVSIWFWRLHNHIAKEIGTINSCWNDQKLFETARDINIAMATQVYYYELWAGLMGRDNLVRDGVLAGTADFRDIYNKDIIPQISLEYTFTLRWVHTLQETTVKMFDNEGNYLKKIPIANLTLRTGYLSLDNNIDYITQGSFRQGSGKIDHVIDPEIAEFAVGKFQRATDVPTNDMAKNRYFGFQPYIKYREHCFKKPYMKFNDLHDAIDAESVELLQDVYQHVEDIDLMAGLWLEKRIEGGYVPATFYCLIVDQLKRNIVSDRHWYERSNRPNAFSKGQLQEIRKATIALILCYVGDGVTRIQPSAFFKASPENRIGGCNELDPIDFWAWEDNSCQ